MVAVTLAIGSLGLLAGFVVFRSCMEARTYTELTGKTVTTWQAMWVDLRVIEPAKSELE